MVYRNDPSTRFLRYVLELPGVGSYISKEECEHDTMPDERIFRYACIPKQSFLDSIQNTVVGTKSALALPARLPQRKLTPPQWNDKDVARINQLIRRKTIHFLVFPVMMMHRQNMCHLVPADRRSPSSASKHMVVVAYNKMTRQIQVWDDRYPWAQTNFGYDKFIDENQLAEFLRPILETFGLDALDTAVVPMFRENAFGDARVIFKERGYATDFATIYEAFLAAFLETHTKPENAIHVITQFSSGLPRVTYTSSQKDAFFAMYEKLRAHNGTLPPIRTQQGTPPTSPSASRSKFHRDGRTQVMIYTPCPEGQSRDISSGRCEEMDSESKNIHVEEHFLTGKHFYPSHITKFYVYILMYLLDKYKNSTAMLSKQPYASHPSEYSLFWMQQKRTSTTQPRFVLTTPPGFETFMEHAMHKKGVRFIILPLFIKSLQSGHVNTVIVDKRLNTVERFEPNDTYAYVRNPRDELGNGELLDDALKSLFAEYHLEYLDAMASCMAGFHTHEFYQLNKNVHDLGGRCAEWSLWYMDTRLANPDVPREKLMSVALEKIRMIGSFKHYISGYIDHMVKQSRFYRKKEYATAVRTRNTLPPRTRIRTRGVREE